MTGYYPEAIRKIEEFKAIIDSESPEIDELHEVNESNLLDAYLTTMGESRIAQWEMLLGISPSKESSVEDRRNNILAAIRGQSKLNTHLIKTIVETFTNANCNTWIENSTLYIRVLPPKNGKDYQLGDLTKAIASKLPAHLGYDIAKAWKYWQDVNSEHISWSSVNEMYATWDDVLYDKKGKANLLDYSTFENFTLG